MNWKLACSDGVLLGFRKLGWEVHLITQDENNIDRQVRTLFRTNNLGCGEGPSTAITWFFENEPEGIIVEDDCLPSLSFFNYAEEMLERCRNLKVMGVHADGVWPAPPGGQAPSGGVVCNV